MPSFVVKMKCTVIKEVICDDCTEEQATEQPWEHATQEQELEQTEWEVLDVKENN
jgi:hypothetical protein